MCALINMHVYEWQHYSYWSWVTAVNKCLLLLLVVSMGIIKY